MMKHRSKHPAPVLSRRESLQVSGLVVLGAAVGSVLLPSEALAADGKVELRFYRQQGENRALLQTITVPEEVAEVLANGPADSVKMIWSVRTGKDVKRISPRPVPGGKTLGGKLANAKRKVRR